MYSNRYSAFDNIYTQDSRKVAYNILSNEHKIKEKLYKTKMCKHKNCKNKNCTYAHTKDELKPLMCFFGDDCIYKNSKNKPCKMMHPSDNICKPVDAYDNKIFIKKIL